MHPAALVVALSFAQDIPAAPPPLDPNAPSGTPAEAQQKAELDNAEKEDSGRNFEIFWVDASLGGSYIDMRQFSSSSLQLEKASSGGPAFSLGTGIRLAVLVLGVRARYNALSAFNMWQLQAEAGLKFPISKFDLLIGLHGGYSFVGSLGDASVSSTTSTPANTDAVKIRGLNAGLDLALDYYFTPLFSAGIGGTADFLYLSRPPVALPANIPPEQVAAIQNDPLYKDSGTTAGLELGIGLRVGVHFGL